MPDALPRHRLPRHRSARTESAALRLAAEACRFAVADYQAGLLDDEQLCRALVRSGVVVEAGAVWLLDVESGQWWRYDGSRPQLASANSGADSGADSGAAP